MGGGKTAKRQQDGGKISCWRSAGLLELPQPTELVLCSGINQCHFQILIISNAPFCYSDVRTKEVNVFHQNVGYSVFS